MFMKKGDSVIQVDPPQVAAFRDQGYVVVELPKPPIAGTPESEPLPGQVKLYRGNDVAFATAAIVPIFEKSGWSVNPPAAPAPAPVADDKKKK
jgi:hypothetical protein